MCASKAFPEKVHIGFARHALLRDRRFLNFRQQCIDDGLRGQDPYMLPYDYAVLVDQEGFRQAIDAPFDSRASAFIDTDCIIGVAQLVKKMAGILRQVLVIDSSDPNTLITVKLHQQRVFLPARCTPRCPDIDQCYLSLKV